MTGWAAERAKCQRTLSRRRQKKAAPLPKPLGARSRKNRLSLECLLEFEEGLPTDDVVGRLVRVGLTLVAAATGDERRLFVCQVEGTCRDGDTLHPVVAEVWDVVADGHINRRIARDEEGLAVGALVIGRLLTGE